MRVHAPVIGLGVAALVLLAACEGDTEMEGSWYCPSPDIYFEFDGMTVITSSSGSDKEFEHDIIEYIPDEGKFVWENGDLENYTRYVLSGGYLYLKYDSTAGDYPPGDDAQIMQSGWKCRPD